MARDDRVVLLGEDVGTNGGVFRATDGALDRFGAEPGLRHAARRVGDRRRVGRALGRRPRAARRDPVRRLHHAGVPPVGGQLARLRYRSRGRFHCPVTVRAPYGGGVRTPEHHADSVEAPYAHTPGLTVVVPSNAADAKGLLASAIRSDDPVLVLRADPVLPHAGDVPDGEHVVAARSRRRRARGRRRSRHHVGCHGRRRARGRPTPPLEARARRSAWSICARSTPLDTETHRARAEHAGRVVVVHEAPLTVGFGAEVVATVQEEAF